MRHRFILLIAFVLALALPGTALAANEVEPNDSIDQATGPLEAATNYDGTTASYQDADWFIFYVSGPGDFDLSLNNLNNGLGCCGNSLSLRDRNGDELNYASVSEGETEHLIYNSPGAGVYYAVVESGETSDTYRLRVEGALFAGPPTGPVDETVPNNNPDRGSAFGPLAGGRTYGGSIDAYGEDDWFYFNTGGAGPFEIAITNSMDSLGCCGLSAELFDHKGNSLSYASVGENRIGRLALTAPGHERYYLAVSSGDTGDHYRFSISPPGLLTATDPAYLSPECKAAKKALKKAKKKKAKVKSKLSYTYETKKKKKLRKKLKKAKKKLKKAKKQVKAVC